MGVVGTKRPKITPRATPVKIIMIANVTITILFTEKHSNIQSFLFLIIQIQIPLFTRAPNWPVPPRP